MKTTYNLCSFRSVECHCHMLPFLILFLSWRSEEHQKPAGNIYNQKQFCPVLDIWNEEAIEW